MEGMGSAEKGNFVKHTRQVQKILLQVLAISAEIASSSNARLQFLSNEVGLDREMDL